MNRRGPRLQGVQLTTLRDEQQYRLHTALEVNIVSRGHSIHLKCPGLFVTLLRISWKVLEILQTEIWFPRGLVTPDSLPGQVRTEEIGVGGVLSAAIWC